MNDQQVIKNFLDKIDKGQKIYVDIGSSDQSNLPKEIINVIEKIDPVDQISHIYKLSIVAVFILIIFFISGIYPTITSIDAIIDKYIYIIN